MKPAFQTALLLFVASLAAVTGTHAQELRANPDDVTFRCVLVGETGVQTIEIENRVPFPAGTVTLNLPPPFLLNTADRSFTLGPQEKRKVQVKFNPPSPGSYVGNLVIHYSNRDLLVPLRGNASNPPRLLPEPGRYLIGFGNVMLGDTVKDTVTIGAISCRELVVDTLVFAGSPDFRILQSISIPDTFDDDVSRRRLIRLEFNPTRVGPASASLRYRGSYKSVSGGVTVVDTVFRVAGTGVRAGLETDPDSIDFEEVSIFAIGTPELVVVENPGNFSTSIQKIEVVGADSLNFLVQHPPLPVIIAGKRGGPGSKDTLHVRVAFAPTHTGSHHAALRITGPDVDDVVTLPLEGVAISPPELEARPRDIDFGNVATGFTRRLNDTISIFYLDGPDPEITIDQVFIGGNDPGAFSVAPLAPVVVRRGESARFSVSFSPTAPQRYNGRVFFRVDGEETVTVDLVGRGVPPSVVVFPRQIDFGPVTINTVSPSRQIALVNLGPVAIDINPIELLGPDSSQFIFSPAAPIRLKARGGDTAYISVEMAPTAPVGPRNAILRLAHGGADTVTLTGRAVVDGASARPRLVNMGSIPVGLTRTLRDTIHIRFITPTNDATTIDSIRWMGADAANFSIIGSLPATIGGPDSATFDVSFTPDAERPFVARALFILGNGTRLPVFVQGVGVGRQLVATPSPLLFPATEISRTSPPETVTVANLAIVGRTIDSVRILPLSSTEFQVDAGQGVGATLDPAGSGGGDSTRIIVRFAPTDQGDRAATLRVYHDGAATLDVPLQGTGLVPSVVANPPIIELGTLRVRETRQVSNLAIENNGAVDVEIIGLAPLGSASISVTIDGTALPRTLAPTGKLVYSVVFTPAAVGPYSETITFLLSTGDSLVIPARGEGLPRGAHRVSLDTIYTDVNQLRPMTATIEPAIEAADNIATFRARLRYDPQSIHIASDPAGNPAVRQIAPDTLEISGSAPTGGRLFRFEFRGLVTGKPDNLMEFVSLELSGTDSLPVLRNGFVLLSGCDIAHSTAFGRPARAYSISPNPASTTIDLRYEAPQGSFPRVRIVALTGAELDTRSLPEATGGEQTASIDLPELRSGLYFLELRLGTQRSSLPLLLTR